MNLSTYIVKLRKSWRGRRSTASGGRLSERRPRSGHYNRKSHRGSQEWWGCTFSTTTERLR